MFINQEIQKRTKFSLHFLTNKLFKFCTLLLEFSVCLGVVTTILPSPWPTLGCDCTYTASRWVDIIVREHPIQVLLTLFMMVPMQVPWLNQLPTLYSAPRLPILIDKITKVMRHFLDG